MAITIEQARELTSEERTAIRGLERKIDQEIRNEFPDYDGRACYTLSPNETGLLTNKVLAELKRRYNAAGWNMECHFEYQWGDSFLELRPNR